MSTLMNDDGDAAGERAGCPKGLDGIRGFHELVAAHVDDPGRGGGRDRDRPGLVGQALVAAGYQVYAINPLAASRYRDRHNVVGREVRCRVTPRCSPIWCAPTATTTARSPVTAPEAEGDQGPGPSASEPDLGPHPAHQRAAQRAARVLPGRAGGVRLTWPIATRLAVLASAPTPAEAGAADTRPDPAALRRGWPATQHRYAAPARSRRALRSRAARRAARGRRRVRGDHPRRGRDHRRTEPPDRRARGRAGRPF